MTIRFPKDEFSPKPEHKFTFGLWTVGNPGADPFGLPTREKVNPVESVHKLGEMGAHGVNFHDDDLIPVGSSPAERTKIIADFKKALSASGMKVPMATTNLFTDPVFKDGAFTANDRTVRAYALQKVMRAMDLGKEFGAETYVFWGGREGVEVNASKSPIDAVKRMREALNFLCEYSKSQNYGYKFALEAKPNEPRGDIFLPTTGHMLAFIETLDHSEMVGVNPEVAHEVMPGLDMAHVVGQALEAGKLFHIDLNGQKPGRYDQDLRFGSEDQKGAFFLVKLLEDSKYDGMRHFDSHAYRTESQEGVWDFAYASMRTYNILKAKAARFNADAEIQGILKELKAMDETPVLNTTGTLKFSPEFGSKLKEHAFDVPKARAHGYDYERLDQLTTELLLGIR